MSCTIYLVRHGIAAPASATVSDADRPLTAAGERKMRRAAAGLKRLGVAPDVILSSPLRRAEETAAAIAAVLAPDCAGQTYAGLAPGHASTVTVHGLRDYRGARQLVLVGHEPSIGHLASFLLTGSPDLLALEFRKGSVAAMQVGGLPPRAPAVLSWFLSAKQLRAIGRRA